MRSSLSLSPPLFFPIGPPVCTFFFFFSSTIYTSWLVLFICIYIWERLGAVGVCVRESARAHTLRADAQTKNYCITVQCRSNLLHVLLCAYTQRCYTYNECYWLLLAPVCICIYCLFQGCWRDFTFFFLFYLFIFVTISFSYILCMYMLHLASSYRMDTSIYIPRI